MSFGGPQASHTNYSYRVPSRPVPVGPVHLNFRASVDPRGTRCAYICEFSINWPVACCLFLSSLKRTLDTLVCRPTHLPAAMVHSGAFSSRSFPPVCNAC